LLSFWLDIFLIAILFPLLSRAAVLTYSMFHLKKMFAKQSSSSSSNYL